MIQLRQTVTYSLSIQAMIKGKMEDPAYQFSGRWPCRRSYSWSGKSGYPFTGRYPDRLSWHSTETGFERNDILSGCSKYHEYIRYCKNSIASALAEQIHKNFNYVIKSSSENGYNATVTTEITTFDSDSILADYQEKLDKYLASADAVIDGSQKRYEKSFEILLNSINDNTVTTVNDVDFVLINDGVSWKLQDEGNTLGNAIFGTLTDSPLETSDSEDENISADTDKQTDNNTSTESSSIND